MLHASRAEEEAKISKPVSPINGGKKLATSHNAHNSAGVMQMDSKLGRRVNEHDPGLERLNEISRSRYRQIHIHPGAVPRQQSTESAYVGSKHYPLASGSHLH